MNISLTESAIVVIGSGAGGGTIADRLTDAGKHVVLLEAGPEIGPAEWIQEDIAAFSQLSWLEKRESSGDYAAAKYTPEQPAWLVRAVGGSTLHWNGLAYRFQEHEFKPRSTYGALEGASFEDWPLSLEDLEPYYSLAERRMGVSGAHGMPAHPQSSHYKVMEAAAKRVGYTHIRNTGIAINSREYDSRPACLQMGFCNQGCKINAKWSTLASEVRRARATGRLDLRTESQAVEIEVDRTGRCAAVVYADAAGSLHRQRASLVCLAANSIESARLLLLSKSAAFPDGLANDSGLVGANYMRHVSALAFGKMPGAVNMHRGITTPGSIFDEAAHLPERGFVGGYLMEIASLAPVSAALMLRHGEWGKQWANYLDDYSRLAGMLLNGEEPPVESNRVSLGHAKDRLGLPVAHVHVDEHPMCHSMRDHFRDRAEEMFSAMSGGEVRHGIPPSATHNLGTTRMHEEPQKGVTDAYGRSHSIDNLFISDGSVFTSSAAENPTLTIVALALRQADYLLGRVLQ